MSKRKLSLVAPNTQESNVINIFQVSVSFTDGTTEIINDVIQFGPVPDRDLLAVTLSNRESVIFPITQNIKKYSFHKIEMNNDLVPDELETIKEEN